MGNTIRKMKDITMRAKLLLVLGCALALLACATPCSALDVPAGETWDVSTDVYMYDWLMVYGTLNLKAGALVNAVWLWPGGAVNMDAGVYVLGGMYIDESTTVNITGGQVDFGVLIFNSGTPGSEPQVTVFGTDFKVDGFEWSASGFIPVGVGTELTANAGSPDEFVLVFFGPGDITVQLVNTAVGAVSIDIKPGSDTNPINLKSKGVVPVAVLTADGFVASTVDPQSVLLEGVAPVRWTLEDVDSDGDKDMLFHFRTEDLATVLTQDSTEATLTGETTEGDPIQGTDKVQIVPSKK